MKIFKFLICFLMVYSMTFAQEADSLIEFELEDQFDTVHNNEAYEGKVVIIVGSDRDGSDYNRKWVLPMVDSLKTKGLYDSTAFLGVADLSAVPYMMRFMVSGFMPKDDPQNKIMMDWDGIFAEAYGFKEAHSNIIIFDKQKHKIMQNAVRDVQADTLNIMVDKILEAAQN